MNEIKIENKEKTFTEAEIKANKKKFLHYFIFMCSFILISAIIYFCIGIPYLLSGTSNEIAIFILSIFIPICLIVLYIVLGIVAIIILMGYLKLRKMLKEGNFLK